jgi:hypothetical protein
MTKFGVGKEAACLPIIECVKIATALRLKGPLLERRKRVAIQNRLKPREELS